MKNASPEHGHGIRETLNRRPGWTLGTLGALLLGVVIIRFWPKSPPKAFYTVDDGATYFAHPYVVPPFTYEGQEAVQAVLFICKDEQKPFVGYLMRFTPDGKVKLEERLKRITAQERRAPMSIEGVEVKRPGQPQWVSRFNPQDIGKKMNEAVTNGLDPNAVLTAASTYDQITNVKCPEGKTAVPVGAN